MKKILTQDDLPLHLQQVIAREEARGNKVTILSNGAPRIHRAKPTAYDRAITKVTNKAIDRTMNAHKHGRVGYKFKGEGLRNVK